MKNKRLFVGGLPWVTDNAALKTLFEEGDPEEGTQGCGLDTVESATVVRDRATGKSRGFAFVTMNSLEDAKTAIKNLNGRTYQKRTLKIDEAADQEARRPDFGKRRSGNYRSGDGQNAQYS